MAAGVAAEGEIDVQEPQPAEGVGRDDEPTEEERERPLVFDHGKVLQEKG
jgi:hypothetical protein